MSKLCSPILSYVTGSGFKGNRKRKSETVLISLRDRNAGGLSPERVVSLLQTLHCLLTLFESSFDVFVLT